MSQLVCSASARAFEDEIREKFEDDAPRLIYSDWLEERGDRLGMFLRVFTGLWENPNSYLWKNEIELLGIGVDDRVVVQKALSLVVRSTADKTLTPFQERLIPFWRELYRKVGSATEPIERDEARASVAKAYVARGHKPPELILFVDSPAAGCITAQILPELLSQTQLESGDQLGGQLGGQLWGQLRGQLVDQLVGQLVGQLRDQLRGQLRDQLRGQLGEHLYNCGYGCHDAYWLSTYTFARHVMGLPGLEKVDGLDAMTEVGWWWPFEKVCIVSGRPTKISFDDKQKLHSDDGPAILYPDGYEVWAEHGVRFQPN